MQMPMTIQMPIPLPISLLMLVDVGVNASMATTKTTTSFMRDLLELCGIVSGFDLAATAEAAPAAATTGLL